MLQYISDFSVIKVTGKDSIKLINSLATNLIDDKPNSQSIVYACLLTPNGRFMFDFFFMQCEENYIITNKNYANDIVKYISMYKMSSEASFELTEKRVLYSKDEFSGSFQDPRNSNIGYYKISTSESVDASIDYHTHRIKLKIVDGFYDLTQKESIILDYGFDHLNAISYTKGCYLGQELISRTKHTGIIRKKVCYCSSENDFEKNTEISQNGEKSGKVLGSCGANHLVLIYFEKVDFAKHFKIGLSFVEISQ